MITPFYCPRCRRKLREVLTGAGGVEAGRLFCLSGHGWTMDVKDGLLLVLTELS